MRVGTLTFHRSLNYGSVMQTYALWKAIEAMGHEAKVIDFAPENQDGLYRIFESPTSPKAVAKNLRALPFASRLRRRRTEFDAFLRDNVRLTGEAVTGEIPERLLDGFDAVVAGSDQIWNCKAADFSTEYLLPRGDGFRRVAYAPSLNGSSLADVEGSARMLGSFDALSAREESGSEDIERILGGRRKVPTVLDPTLLLGADGFRQAESAAQVPDKYIFYYSVTYRRASLDYALALARETGLPVIGMFTSARTYDAMLMARGKIRFLDYTAPGDFIRLVDNATYVVSNSFHGTAFSVIFGKRFTAVRSLVDGKPFHDHRVDNLLGQVGLMGCVWEEGGPFSMPAEWDRAAASSKLDGIRNASLGFLSDALS